MKKKIDKIEIPRWFDRHLHLRDGDMLKTVLPCTLKQCATGAVIMGNLKYPDETSSIRNTFVYRKRIASIVPPDINFNPRMTLYLTDNISPREVLHGFEEGIWCAVKLYMANQKGLGGTTGSQYGVKNLLGRYPVFEVMEKKASLFSDILKQLKKILMNLLAR